MQKRIIIPILLLTLTISLSGCDLWEDIKWTLGLVNYGKIEGTVTDIEGNAIEGATVDCRGCGGAISPLENFLSTDENGYYEFTKVPFGYQAIWISKDGHETTAAGPDAVYVEEGKLHEINVSGVYRIDKLGVGGLGILIDESETFAQSFIPGVNKLGKIGFSGASNIIIQIQTDDDGEPSGVILGEQEISETQDVIFDPMITVTSGTKYWIVINLIEDSTSGNSFTANNGAQSVSGELLYSIDSGSSWGTYYYADNEILNISFATYY